MSIRIVLLMTALGHRKGSCCYNRHVAIGLGDPSLLTMPSIYLFADLKKGKNTDEI
jgi:hypothetical protein